MTALYIFLVILAVLLLLFAVLALNAVRAKQRGRRLAPQPDYYSEAELAQHAERLAQMIRCETVSCRESFDDTEFKKLRDTVRELFPLFHEKAQFMTFSYDCWVYKLPGKDQSRNMMVMSHHDVSSGRRGVEAPGHLPRRSRTVSSGAAAQWIRKRRCSRNLRL